MISFLLIGPLKFFLLNSGSLFVRLIIGYLPTFWLLINFMPQICRFMQWAGYPQNFLFLFFLDDFI